MAVDYKVELFGSSRDFPCGETKAPCLLGSGTGLVPFSEFEKALLKEEERKTVEEMRKRLKDKGVVFPSKMGEALELTVILGSDVALGISRGEIAPGGFEPPSLGPKPSILDR